MMAIRNIFLKVLKTFFKGILFPSTKERIAGRRNDNYNIEEDLDNLWFQVSQSLPDELVSNLSKNMVNSSKTELNSFGNEKKEFGVMKNSSINQTDSFKNEKDSFTEDENVPEKITILTKNSENTSKIADNTTRYSILESKKKAEKRIINNAKKFSCCFSKNKNLNCKMIPKTTKKSKKKFKSSELECVYDLMYDIKVSYPGEPIPRGPRHSMIYKI